MRNFRGLIVAAVFTVLGLALMKIVKENYTQLIGLAYPFASKTYMEYLGLLTGKTAMCVWQVVVVLFAVAVVVTFGLMILLRWNVFRWLGWVTAPVAIVFFLFTLVWGLNFYAKPIEDSMKLEVKESYSSAEIREAAIYFRTQADKLAPRVPRDENGDIALPELDEMSAVASKSYDNLVWRYSIFAGPRGPVKALSWSDVISDMGFNGITVGLTGEAGVNMDNYGADIPFTICHEIGHLLAFAREDEANFSGYLACEHSDDDLFRYSGYLNAFIYCANRLNDQNQSDWQAAWKGASAELIHDVNAMHEEAAAHEGPVKEHATAVNNTYLQVNGQENGTESYNDVVELLVAWYQDQYVVDDTPKPTQFDPYSIEDVFPELLTEPTEAEEPEAA